MVSVDAFEVRSTLRCVKLKHQAMKFSMLFSEKKNVSIFIQSQNCSQHAKYVP